MLPNKKRQASYSPACPLATRDMTAYKLDTNAAN